MFSQASDILSMGGDLSQTGVGISRVVSIPGRVAIPRVGILGWDPRGYVQLLYPTPGYHPHPQRY